MRLKQDSVGAVAALGLHGREHLQICPKLLEALEALHTQAHRERSSKIHIQKRIRQCNMKVEGSASLGSKVTHELQGPKVLMNSL
ncbi:hypothetical protein EVAR_24267_1 [Eumeta japonica]|uniref:Uncharacterized protein n=1 Tax=Eumeta variegata TaxID=151549 RepID=A0A4C1VHB5_EUMVA|nr:hypothetical protein EVAR_24267_1 [Eumeta japonica]